MVWRIGFLCLLLFFLGSHGRGLLGETPEVLNKTWGEECSQPCSGPKCGPLADLMRFLVDFTVDPCDDFFAFACSAETRGYTLPITIEESVDFTQLVKFPPKGFEYIRKFYLSCSKVDTGYTTQEVFFDCFEKGGGECNEEEVRVYGDIFAQFLNYTRKFLNLTMMPAVTSDWEEATKDLYEGKGWTWWDFAAQGLKDFFFLEAFQITKVEKNGPNEEAIYDQFRSNIFFTPMIDTAVNFGYLEDAYPKIHIVPMSIHNSLRNGDENYIRKYKALMKSFLLSFGGDPSTVAEDVERIVEMELEVGRINREKWTKGRSGVSITIEELHELVPSVEWKDYIEDAFSDNHQFKIRRGHNLIIPSQFIIRRMGEFADNLSFRDQANLVIWRMFISFANDFMHTGNGDRDLQDDLFSKISETGSRSRSENCIQQIKTFFPEAHNDMFIAKYIDEDTRNTIKTMFSEVSAEFEAVIDEKEWISRTTKIKAKDKLKEMEIFVGETSPNTLEFRKLKAEMSTEDYIGNVLAISNYKWDTLVKNIEEEKKLSIKQDTINAHYNQYRNQIEMLAGMINSLVVKTGILPGIPRALVYGGFVSILGHELVHGFDYKNRHLDKYGHKVKWWKPEEDQIYENITQNLRDKYADFTIDGLQITNPHPQTYNPSDNIADNGGIKLAYRSYKKLPEEEKKCMSEEDLPFTSDQLFWLGCAFSWCTMRDEHEKIRRYDYLLRSSPDSVGHFPSPWRVNTVFSNQPEFATDFQCPNGTRLNPSPEKRATIW